MAGLGALEAEIDLVGSIRILVHRKPSMSASVKVTLVAYLPASQLQAFLQAVRDFDVDNDGCHFQFDALDPGSSMTVDDMDRLLASIEPPFDVRAIIRKQ